MTSTLNYDFVILADVIEHIENLDAFLVHLSTLIDGKTKLIVSAANPFWEPVLLMGEKMRLKMPEGPHRRLSIGENEELFTKAGLEIRQKGYRLLIPRRLPGSDWINRHFYENNFLARLGFIVYWVLGRAASPQLDAWR